jgi:ComF family protein
MSAADRVESGRPRAAWRGLRLWAAVTRIAAPLVDLAFPPSCLACRKATEASNALCDRLELARSMGAWMARAGDELLTEADVLIPVPLHRGRLARRRFNQAALLARSVSDRSGVPLDAFALTRVKPTPPQVGLTRTQRAANMQGAFRVLAETRGHVEGKAVVLIDDVMTSGATINAAARALLRGGARRVDVLVFARVVVG